MFVVSYRTLSSVLFRYYIFGDEGGMATHGTISEFDRAQQDWVTYTECLEQHFAANYVNNDDKKHAILFSIGGGDT